ncbi:PREDICTED: uncharacterized protein LOC105453524 [Wasmannia auropunctata]|uniref:uncharacterized protein LOC105453524 n=1 Tax=Wasmannia auropunctata TaxID=64793 RepID=UPI0005F029C4|nr:PREDICTED: uncharacterized protein LOC105453524 [Wasmannia auropunctata]
MCLVKRSMQSLYVARRVTAIAFSPACSTGRYKRRLRVFQLETPGQLFYLECIKSTGIPYQHDRSLNYKSFLGPSGNLHVTLKSSRLSSRDRVSKKISYRYRKREY